MPVQARGQIAVPATLASVIAAIIIGAIEAIKYLATP